MIEENATLEQIEELFSPRQVRHASSGMPHPRGAAGACRLRDAA